MIDIKNFLLKRKKVKYARISIKRDMSVVITVPYNFTKTDIDDLVKKKSKWILKHLENFKKHEDSLKTLKDDEIIYLGEIYEFRFYPWLEKTIVDNENKIISSGKNLKENGKLEKWYVEEFRKIVNERLCYFSEEYGFSYNKIFIRNQKTRLGSCSGHKNISFNLNLIKAPVYVIDYVIVHELVHTEIMRHDKEFKTRVGSIYPEHKKAQHWLKNNRIT
jgi:predicted metal-dependent hydrolase